MHEDTKWHWGEGFKYAAEAIKTLVVINGAAAVSILTFIGNAKLQSAPLIVALICFAFGVVAGVATQMCSYITQLHYGNATEVQPTESAVDPGWKTATFYHYFTYGFAVSGVVLFVAGVLFAAYGIYSLNPKAEVFPAAAGGPTPPSAIRPSDRPTIAP